VLERMPDLSELLKNDCDEAFAAETSALIGTFYSSGTTVATGPMVSDSNLGKLFILENVSSKPALIQAFDEANYTQISSDSLQVNGAAAGTKYGAGDSTATELNGGNSINTMVRWGANGLAFRAANGIFSFRSNVVQDRSAVVTDLSASLAAPGRRCATEMRDRRCATTGDARRQEMRDDRRCATDEPTPNANWKF
jgi:phage-related tail fiber protein